MQKKLITLAVAGALGAPAVAFGQASTVEIYGRANLGFDNYRATGAAAAASNVSSRNRVFDGGSRIGFRINENLGGGMRAFAVIESGVNMDTGSAAGQSGGANASTATLGTRDTYVGLGGGWGDVRFGRQSIYWVSGPLAQTGPNYTHVDASLITNTGMLPIAVARNNNVVSYNSPTWSGFNFTGSYSTQGGVGGPNTEGATYTGTGQSKANVWGLTLRYNNPQFYAQFDYARARNVSATLIPPATGAATNKSWKAGLGWRYQPGAMLAFIMERNMNDNVGAITTQGGANAFAAAGNDLRQYVYLINWEHMFGQWGIYAQYSWTGSVSGATGANTLGGGSKAKAWGIQAKYHFSKRTGVYVGYAQIRNDANQFADFAGGNMSSAAGNAPGTALGATNSGADPRVIGVGVMHNF